MKPEERIKELESELALLRSQTADKFAWECNECGSQEYTMAVSEEDLNCLGCGNCGGDEWHKAKVK